MKKIFQTRFGYPHGNCHAACLASIFELDIESIPAWGVDLDWYEKFTEWCIQMFGMQPIDIEAESSVFVPRGYYIINGESKNGDFWHSVVGKDGEIVHDPHPDEALKNYKSYTFFVKIIE